VWHFSSGFVTVVEPGVAPSGKPFSLIWLAGAATFRALGASDGSADLQEMTLWESKFRTT
jgi:hypothetical protein